MAWFVLLFVITIFSDKENASSKEEITEMGCVMAGRRPTLACLLPAQCSLAFARSLCSRFAAGESWGVVPLAVRCGRTLGGGGCAWRSPAGGGLLEQVGCFCKLVYDVYVLWAG